MAREQLKTLTEPMYYVLLALTREQHGYGIMQCIEGLTDGRVQVGAGTLYALLSRFEGEGIIRQVREEDRKKIYLITAKGTEVLMEEYVRLEQLVSDGKKCFKDKGLKIPMDSETSRALTEARLKAERAAAEKEAEKESQREAERQREEKEREKERQKELKGGLKGVILT